MKLDIIKNCQGTDKPQNWFHRKSARAIVLRWVMYIHVIVLPGI